MVFLRNGGLTLLAMEEFENEAEIEDLVGSNLQDIFPCLRPLKKQFTIGPRGSTSKHGRNYNRFDMLAFDTKRNCFVVIEYKNKIGTRLIEQLFSYISLIDKSDPSLTDEYVKATGTSKISSEFKWNQSYMITVAGGYTQSQMSAADGALSRSSGILKMYVIRKLGSNTLTLDLVKGSAVCENIPSESKPDEQKKYTRGKSKSYIQSMFEKLDQEIRDITNVNGINKTQYISYKTEWGKILCIVKKQKNQIKLHYALRKPSWFVEGDEFVKSNNSEHNFVGDYISTICKPDDIDKAVSYLKRIFYDLSEVMAREKFKHVNLSIKSQL